MHVNKCDALMPVDNTNASSSHELSSPTKISSPDSAKSEEHIKEIADLFTFPVIFSGEGGASLAERTVSQVNKPPPTEQELKMENSVTIKQLKLLFEERYNKPKPWPRVYSTRHVYFDCEGLAHYLMTGTIGKFEEIKTLNIYKVDLKKEHKPYTCYRIWQPHALWARPALGFWASVHYFTHLENGKYISQNCSDPYRIFDSFEDMLKKDAFPHCFLTEDCERTYNIELAVIGESLVGTIH